jgi:hypothetical protein
MSEHNGKNPFGILSLFEGILADYSLAVPRAYVTPSTCAIPQLYTKPARHDTITPEAINMNDDRVNDDRTSWHPAFVEAIQAELFDYVDVLEYHSEFQLSAEALRIDLLVIKKLANVCIDKNIARIFRGHNIIEYKSPDDTFTREDLMKVCGYVYLYSAHTRVSLRDVTLTISVMTLPRKLRKYLWEELGVFIERHEPGIYYGKLQNVPLQIIESKQLSPADNAWLNILRKEAELETAQAIATSFNSSTELLSRVPLQAFIDVMWKVNYKAFMEVYDKMYLSQEARNALRGSKIWQEAQEEARDEMLGLFLRSKGTNMNWLSETTGIPLDQLRAKQQVLIATPDGVSVRPKRPST